MCLAEERSIRRCGRDLGRNAATRCRPKLPEPGKQLPEQVLHGPGTGIEGAGVRIHWLEQANRVPFKNHEHDDTRPAASYHRDMHIVHCFKCGETWLACDVGPVLGLPSVTTLRRSVRRRCRCPKPTKPSTRLTTNNAMRGRSHQRTTNPAIPSPRNGDSLAYFYADFYHYENGFWSPMPGVDGLIWDELKLHKVDGIRPTSARVSSVRSYVTDKLRVPKELVENGDNYINLQNGLQPGYGSTGRPSTATLSHFS